MAPLERACNTARVSGAEQHNARTQRLHPWLRGPIIALAAILASIAALVIVAAIRAAVDSSEAVDPKTPIHLRDGRIVPLSEAIAILTSSRATDSHAPTGSPPRQTDPVYSAATQAEAAGRLDEAMALYLSVDKSSRNFARAQRQVGWEILTKGKGNL